MGKEMIVDTEYAGYVFVGWAAGRFKTERGEMMPYANMFVLSPVSSYESDDYQAMGMKAEKKKCLSPEVWADLEPGDRVKLSFTTKQHTPEQVIAALGLSECPWSDITGAHGYMDRKYFGNISIHYNGREDMGVWCEMSGQGCRNFEDLTTLSDKWQTLFAFIYSNSLHITRLDAAFDDHTGILDIERIAQDTQEQRFVSRMKYWEVVRSSGGTSCQIGSPKSKVLVRIYDKVAERGFTDGRHWVRVELQLRDKRAEEFLKIPMRIGEAFAGVLLNYLRFVEPDTSDSNKSRWKMTDYWAALVGDIGRIKIFTVPGGAYNAEKCRHYVFDMAGNAIDAMLQMCDSVDDFLVRLYTRRCRPNPKYKMVVKEYHARQEAFAEKVRQYFAVEDEPEEL